VQDGVYGKLERNRVTVLRGGGMKLNDEFLRLQLGGGESSEDQTESSALMNFMLPSGGKKSRVRFSREGGRCGQKAGNR